MHKIRRVVAEITLIAQTLNIFFANRFKRVPSDGSKVVDLDWAYRFDCSSTHIINKINKVENLSPTSILNVSDKTKKTNPYQIL